MNATFCLTAANVKIACFPILQPFLPALVVGGQEVARDEVAVCDLSGGAPTWKVTKKKVERVN